MKYLLAIGGSLLCFLAGPTVQAQNVQINRSNKTVEVQAKGVVAMDADYAEVKLGYSNYGRTQQAALAENARIANQILQALQDAGVPRENIETQKASVKPVEDDDKKNWPKSLQEERQFQARQSWTIRVSAPDAQKAVSLAISKGATEFEDVDWFLADADVAESKANAAALAKARLLAEQMAKNAGAKLGELLYVSNSIVRDQEFIQRFWLRASLTQSPENDLRLYPRKIRKEVEVSAVFVLE